MNMRTIMVLLVVFLSCSLLQAQVDNKAVWNNKKAAVCLTYDDGLDIDLDNVMPALDSLGLKGTFYIPGNSASLSVRINDWRALAAKGHEIGNHTLFHACEGGKPGREWVNPNYDLTKYTMKRIVDEILLGNTLFSAIDGKNQRTFAYACGDSKVEGSEFMEKMKNNFVAARSTVSKMYKISEIDVYNVGSFMMINNSGDDMINLVKKAMESNSLIVFLFHGVGGGHNLNVSLEAHRKLLVFLKQNEKDIWVAPFIDVMKFVKDHNKTK